jgi:hypothetical protein
MTPCLLKGVNDHADSLECNLIHAAGAAPLFWCDACGLAFLPSPAPVQGNWHLKLASS